MPRRTKYFIVYPSSLTFLLWSVIWGTAYVTIYFWQELTTERFQRKHSCLQVHTDKVNNKITSSVNVIARIIVI